MKRKLPDHDVINVEDTGKITEFFSIRKHGNARKVLAYTRQGNFVYVEHILEGNKLDSNTFDISTEKGNDSFCRYAFEKLGADFKGYKRRKDIEWQ